MKNVEFIVLRPEAVRAIFMSIEKQFQDAYESYNKWAVEMDEKSKSEVKRILDLREKDLKEWMDDCEKREKENEAAYQRLLDKWQRKFPLFRGPKPKKEFRSMDSVSGGSRYPNPYKPYPCETSYVDWGDGIKKEFDDMIASSSNEIKELHFTQDQHQRMLDWQSGQILNLMKSQMESKELCKWIGIGLGI